MEITENNANRLAFALIEKHQLSYSDAESNLLNLNLNLQCGEKIKESIPLQAAILTAINTGKRAFLGGVFINLPDNTPCLVNWPQKLNFNELVEFLGAKINKELECDNFSLYFGLPCINKNSLRVVCDSWKGGVLTPDDSFVFEENGNLPLGGILAGALGICHAFYKASNIDNICGNESFGLSLLDLDGEWKTCQNEEPEIIYLPKNYWILGLGHLGQAYLWSIGLLPYQMHKKVNFILQDYDIVNEANYSAGLLCEMAHDKLKKTRVCANWLEERGFITSISERMFNSNTVRIEDEPFIALCGFDSGKSRLALENAGFDLVVEAGLGGRLSNFDTIVIHTFPNGSKQPNEIWTSDTAVNINPSLLNAFEGNEICGILPIKIASKSISASFVGAFTGAIVIAELLKGLHGKKRIDKAVISMRNLDYKKIIYNEINYTTEMAKNGFEENK
ncbi:MAG: hypothetical protein PSX81_03750 [bacterium]|nr:hypothetical protein [bacterium]